MKIMDRIFFAAAAAALAASLLVGCGASSAASSTASSAASSEAVSSVAASGEAVSEASDAKIKAQFNAAQVLTRRLTITGSTLRPQSVAFKAAIAQALRRQVWPLLASGAVRPVIHSQFPATEAAQAHALMESNQHIGKIVLTWTNA